MEFLHTIQPVYVLAGFLVGALVGITGVGGGALMTPILIFFGIPPVAAVGTDLLYASLTKTGGTLVHGYNHTVDWRVVIRLGTGSIPAAALTLMTLYELHIGSADAQELVTKVLGVALLLTALALLFRKPLTRAFIARVGELDPELVRQADDRVRCAAGRAGVDFLGRRGRHRRHGADPALSENVDGADRRLGHRPCRAADAGRRDRPLDARLDQLDAAGDAADRLVAGHLRRQLSVGAAARHAGPHHAGRARC